MTTASLQKADVYPGMVTAAEIFAYAVGDAPYEQKLDLIKQVAFQTYSHSLKPPSADHDLPTSSAREEVSFNNFIVRSTIERLDLLSSLVKILFSGRSSDDELSVEVCKTEDVGAAPFGLLLTVKDTPSLIVGFLVETQEIFCRQVLPNRVDPRRANAVMATRRFSLRPLAPWLQAAANTNKRQ